MLRAMTTGVPTHRVLRVVAWAAIVLGAIEVAGGLGTASSA
jgi:hypothetical protein